MTKKLTHAQPATIFLTQTLDEHWPMLQLDPFRGSDQLLWEKIICYQADTGQWIGTLIQMSAFFAQQKAKRVTQRNDGVDAVMITTPNYMHYPTAKIFLDAGFDVICDKPLTNTIEEASSLGDCAHFLS